LRYLTNYEVCQIELVFTNLVRLTG